MSSIRSSVLKMLEAGALTAFALLLAFPARAQTRKGCGEIISGMDSIGSEPSNPFTAEWVTTDTMISATGEKRTRITTEDVARDSDGRIRIEKHGVATPPNNAKTVTLYKPDGETFTVTAEEWGTTIEIFDCSSGTHTRIQPGSRVAFVNVDARPGRSGVPNDHYIDLQAPPPDMKFPPEVTVEQLGAREIQGIQARGVRMTTLGKEKDGDWNGKPLRQTETWVSDDLQVRMRVVAKDLRTGIDESSELTIVKRDNPDPNLFEIPSAYDINPAVPGGLPGVKGIASPAPAQ